MTYQFQPGDLIESLQSFSILAGPVEMKTPSRDVPIHLAIRRSHKYQSATFRKGTICLVLNCVKIDWVYHSNGGFLAYELLVTDSEKSTYSKCFAPLDLELSGPNFIRAGS